MMQNYSINCFNLLIFNFFQHHEKALQNKTNLSKKIGVFTEIHHI